MNLMIWIIIFCFCLLNCLILMVNCSFLNFLLLPHNDSCVFNKCGVNTVVVALAAVAVVSLSSTSCSCCSCWFVVDYVTNPYRVPFLQVQGQRASSTDNSILSQSCLDKNMTISQSWAVGGFMRAAVLLSYFQDG